jgi:DNA-binding CsgD family transcriptional regulator
MGNTPFWPLGPRIAATLGCESASLSALGGTNGPVEALSLTGNCLAMLPGYIAYYHKHDAWAALGQSQPPDIMVASQDHILDAEFRRTEFYQDHCRPSGTAYVLGAVVNLGPDGARGVIGFHRSETQAQFSAADKHHGALLLPHIRRAMQLRERLVQLDMQQRSMQDATDALGVGVMVVTQEARILSANPLAEALLRHTNGLFVDNHCLSAALPFLHDELRRTIRNAAQAGAGRALQAGGLVRIPHGQAGPLMLSIYPLIARASSDGGTIPAALIFIADAAAAQPPQRDVLARIYGLTPAEARLFAALLTGERLQDYADRFGISLQTAKTQLGHIFHKTGHSRQSDLVRDALSNPILRLKRP